MESQPMEKMEIAAKRQYRLQKKCSKKNSDTISNKFHDKKIMKKKKRKAPSRTCIQNTGDNFLTDFVKKHCPQYFQLSERQAKDKVLHRLRSSTLIQDILSQIPNVYKLPNTVEAKEHARAYLKLLKRQREGCFWGLRLKNNTKSMLLACSSPGQQNGGVQSRQFLSFSWYQLMERRSAIKTRLNNVCNNKNRPPFEDRQIELMTLSRINKDMELGLELQIQNMIAEDRGVLHQAHIEDHSKSLQLENNYCQLLVKKNLAAAFQEDPIEYLHYFRQIQINELGLDSEEDEDQEDQLTPILNQEQFLAYIRECRPKMGKPKKKGLRTVCACCFSNLNQNYNKLERCKQCNMRMHSLCHSIRKTCEFCKYTRKSQSEKNDRPYCFICDRSKEYGLSLETLKNSQDEFYAHSFCLLTSGFWHIQDKEVSFEVDSAKIGQDVCKFCQKQGLCLTATCCGQKVHTLCAFLEGCSLSLREGKRVQVWCCTEGDRQRRLAFDRKFKLNFERMLFKKAQGVLDFIQSSC